MSGQGLAGTFAAFSMICALASKSQTSRTPPLVIKAADGQVVGKMGK